MKKSKRSLLLLPVAECVCIAAVGKALLVKEVLEDEELCAALQEYFRQSAPR